MSLGSPKSVATTEIPTEPPPEYEEEGGSSVGGGGSGPGASSTPLGCASRGRGPDGVPGLCGLPAPLGGYVPRASKLSADLTTLTVCDAALLKSPRALVDFVRAQAALPPVPYVRIRGGADGANFDVKINMLRYLAPPPLPPSSSQADGLAAVVSNQWNYTRLTADSVKFDGRRNPGVPDATLDTLARAFCRDSAADKAFVFSRKVINWDRDFLVGGIRNLLAELHFAGKVEVTFPMAHATVVVTPQTSMLDKFVSLFNSRPRRYEALEAVWPYASAPPHQEEEGQNGGSGNGSASPSSSRAPARSFAVRSERAWWNDWKPVIERAVLNGTKGSVGIDDLLEVRLGYPGPQRPTTEWGSNKTA